MDWKPMNSHRLPQLVRPISIWCSRSGTTFIRAPNFGVLCEINGLLAFRPEIGHNTTSTFARRKSTLSMTLWPCSRSMWNRNSRYSIVSKPTGGHKPQTLRHARKLFSLITIFHFRYIWCCPGYQRPCVFTRYRSVQRKMVRPVGVRMDWADRRRRCGKIVIFRSFLVQLIQWKLLNRNRSKRVMTKTTPNFATSAQIVAFSRVNGTIMAFQRMWSTCSVRQEIDCLKPMTLMPIKRAIRTHPQIRWTMSSTIAWPR